MVTKLQIFIIKKNSNVDFIHTCSAVISLDSALKKDDNYCLQVFLKERKYIEKKVIRHIIDDFESSFDDSNDSDKQHIKAMKSMFFIKNNFRKRTF